MIDVLSNYVYSISLLLIIELYHSLSLYCCIRDDPDARSTSRKLITLALLPLNQVELAFNNIVTDSLHCIEQLLNYVKSYWMIKVKLSLWNIAELDVRINNNVKGTCLSFSSIKLLFLALF
jgi:hypothetical protein